MPLTGARPEWLTFDCYGTLIQWDEGLLEAVTKILARHGKADIEAGRLIQVYDRHEHRLEQEKPHRSFREVSGIALRSAMEELGLAYASDDTLTLTSNISKMPPFPEVVETLASLKAAGFKLCIISNTDDDIIAVNLQTAWLSPPVALSAYFLKGVVPEWDLKDIYLGMMQFMLIQLFGLVMIIIFPQIALWLPEYIYGP